MLAELRFGRMDCDTRSSRLYARARQRGGWQVGAVVAGLDRPGLDAEWAEWAWQLTSSSVYAEQTGLVVAASLLQDVDELTARMCLATAVSDEAKHVEVFATAAELLGGSVLPVRPAAETAYAELIALDDWMDRFVVHTMLEGFAMDEFALFMRALGDSAVEQVYAHVRRDEIAHVAMGLDYLTARLPDPAFAGTRERFDELEQFAFRVGGVDDAFFINLAPFAGRTPEDFRRAFVDRHRHRMRATLVRGGDSHV
jgi:hypothetical protein